MTQRYVVVDLETTGNSVKKGDKIIQFAAVVVENNQIVDEFSTFINPKQHLTPFIEELTGINDEQLQHAPTFSEVAPAIVEYLQDACFVAHNVLFDLSFLQDELVANGFEPIYCSTIDTVELAKIMRPSATSYKLVHLATEEGFQHDRPHQADSDAYVTAELFLLFTQELRNLPLVTLKQLYRLSFSLKSELSELLALILEERNATSPIHHPHVFIYKGIALRKPDESSGYSIADVAAFPTEDEEKIRMLQRAFSSLEIRTDQLKMMDIVYQTFQESKHALIEAGTGLGKTLGYLLPAAYYSVRNQEPVIISTYTIDLQNQLIHKELVHLQQMLPFPITTAILKGRSNYISLAKFDRALRMRDDHYDSALTKMQILIWLLHTETGDRDELNLTSGGELYWERLQSAKSITNSLQSAWQHLDFFDRAKSYSEKADLIITNHAYLMTDYFSKTNQQLKSHTLIIDEAHQLENAALKHLGQSIDYISMKMQINKIGLHEQKQLLYKLNTMRMDAGLGAFYESRQHNLLIQETVFELEQFFQLLSTVCQEVGQDHQYKNTLTIQTLLHTHRNAQHLVMIAERLSEQFHKLGFMLQCNVDELIQKASPGKTQLFHLSEIEQVAETFLRYAEQLKEYFLHNKDSVLYWAEWNKNSPSRYVYLYSQPIEGGTEMWFRFFGQQKSVILTSSTLTVKGSFQYMRNKMGLHNEHIETYSFPSPFNFKEQVQLFVASDIPDVNSVSQEEYAESISSYIAEAAIACRGRMLVLFTSQEMLKTTHDLLKENALLSDFNILSQGISSNSKSRLIKYFQNIDKSILLGTASFWDGLDLPGETLECLMIVRLPFSSPTDPITEARCRLITEKGGNAFSSYSLPEAIMRFRQGFGRLIRTKEDKGVCIVCDKRIISTSYGGDFLRSIPKVDVIPVISSEIHDKIKTWLPK
ncbi:MAG: ATP-dependent DNA helicase DinG [Bacillus sp. (in: firmicutes)]